MAAMTGRRGDFRGVLTRLHRIADITAEQTAEGDALTEEGGDPDGTGPKRETAGCSDG
jgi:hypothetical protein